MAHVVELWRRTPAAQAEIVARYVLTGRGPVEVVGVHPNGERYARELVEQGLPGAHGERVYLTDGEAFLEALPAAFHGSRWWATQPFETD